MAARRAGLKRVVLPRENRGDLRELPDHVRNEMEFVLVDRIDQVLDAVLAAAGRRRAKESAGKPPRHGGRKSKVRAR